MTTTYSFCTAESFLDSRVRLSPIVNLNGKSYHLTVYYKKSNTFQEKDITQSYLKLVNQIDLQEILQQVEMPYSKKIEIQTSIHPNINSICCNIQNGNRKINIFLTKSQSFKIFRIFKKIRRLKNVLGGSSSLLYKENLERLNSSFIKMSLEEIKVKRIYDYLKEVNTNFNTSENSDQKSLEYYERAIGLGNSKNNCCVNALLQIILNNQELRQIWEKHFPKVRDLYYEALREGKPSASNAVSDEFRRQLVLRLHSSSNLIDQNFSTQDDPTAFLAVFFNVCKNAMNLSHMEINFEKMKYKQIGDEEQKPTIKQPEKHQEFRISIINRLRTKTTLEELLQNHSLDIFEVVENGMKVKYLSKDQYISLPNHLIIDLFTVYGKDTSTVCIPTHFRFPQDLLKDEHAIYEYVLEAFILHSGKTHDGGHYIAFRKVNGQWKEFNDHVVTDINENQLQQILGNFQKEKSKGVMRYVKPYICMLSFSKKGSL